MAVDFDAVNGAMALEWERNENKVAAADTGTDPRRGIENSGDGGDMAVTGGPQLQHRRIRVSNLFRGQQGGEAKADSGAKVRIGMGWDGIGRRWFDGGVVDQGLVAMPMEWRLDTIGWRCDAMRCF